MEQQEPPLAISVSQIVETFQMMEQTIQKLIEENERLKYQLNSPEYIASNDLNHMMRIIENAKKMGVLDISKNHAV